MRRHDMIHVDPAIWAAFIAPRPELVQAPVLASWCAQGWPLVARRGTGTEPPGDVPLGLPLPPAMGKRRLFFALPSTALRPPMPPPLLSEAAVDAPPAWRGVIAQLVAAAPRVRVFGSLAWQHLTGLPYLAATSDLDLLWQLPASDPAGLLDDIAAIAANAPMRVDGEIVREDGVAANWREAVSAPEILVKSLHGVSLMPRRVFLAAMH